MVAASGPSLQASDLELVKAAGLPLMVVNDAWRLAPWANWLYACDERWWRVHFEATKAFQGERWTQHFNWRREGWKQYGLNCIRSVAAFGLGTGGVIHQGGNSGFQAVNLAFHFGFRVVILLGFDMSGNSHFFGSHEQHGLIDCPDYGCYVHAFNLMHPEQHGLTVINCSRRSALTCFEKRQLEDVLQLYQTAAALPA